jgi:hypothetical protein
VLVKCICIKTTLIYYCVYLYNISICGYHSVIIVASMRPITVRYCPLIIHGPNDRNPQLYIIQSPWGICDHSRFWIWWLSPFVKLLPKTFKVFGFAIFRLWAERRLNQKRAVWIKLDIYVSWPYVLSTKLIFTISLWELIGIKWKQCINTLL